MTDRPLLAVEEVRFFERHVHLRMPFRFGIVTLTEAPQLFVRARVRFDDGTEHFGQSAELLAPKWFDKNPELTNEQNFDQLRTSLAIGRRRYLDAGHAQTAFGLHATVSPDHYQDCAARDLNGLVAGFGPALIDRAVLDALCTAKGVSVFEAVQKNLPGIDAATTPDLESVDLAGFLARLRPATTIHARHTVGMVDAITEGDIAPGNRIGDGLPESLEAVIAAYGHRYFKLKVGGDMAADIDRLKRIASVLDLIPDPYFVSLDGNEQYGAADAVVELLKCAGDEPALARLLASTLYIEQPISRAHALEKPIHRLAALKPVAIDESDADIDAFPAARKLGYAGISSKSCKGFYRSVLNSTRAALWNSKAAGAPYFMTAEDLTTQAGVAVQQDLALATLVGCTHVERNGHHYVNGMAGAPKEEQQRFLAAHPDLYHDRNGRVRIRITNGQLGIGSLAAHGLGAKVEPDWRAMSEKDYGNGT